MSKKSKKSRVDSTIRPRSTELEIVVEHFLESFNNEYTSFQNKMGGKERQARLREELLNYTNDLRSEAVRKKAIEVWNAMAATYGISFGEPKHFIPNERVNVISQSIVDGLEPLIGEVAPVRSKKFLSAIRDGISYSGSKIRDAIGGTLKNVTLPAQDPSQRKVLDYKPETYEGILNNPNYRIQKVEGVKTKRSELATYQIDFSDPNVPEKDKKYIIHFNGNGTYAMQTVDEMALEAKSHNCVVINFDYPGVGESTGHSKRSKHMVEAGLAQVKRLTDMGVPPENILLKGQSIGGGTATLTAAKLHAQGQKVALYNQRSFSKLSSAAKQMLGGGVIGSIAAGVIKASGWEMDAIKAWKKIPDGYKDFCFAADDTVIPPATAGLAGALGKTDDKDKKLWGYVNTTDQQLAVGQDGKSTYLIGHNNDIYNDKYDGSRTIMTANENGKPTKEMFDSFAEKMFKNPMFELKDEQKQQLTDLLQALLKFNAQPTSGSRGILTFRQQASEQQKVLGKNAPQLIALLQAIEKTGKVTEKQISDIQHLCQRAQKKAGINPPPKVAEFLQKATTFIEAITPAPKEQTAKMSPLSRN